MATQATIPASADLAGAPVSTPSSSETSTPVSSPDTQSSRPATAPATSPAETPTPPMNAGEEPGAYLQRVRAHKDAHAAKAQAPGRCLDGAR